MTAIHVQVLDRNREVYRGDFQQAVELGRQSDGREELYRERQVNGGRWRVVVAPLDEDSMSRQQAVLEPLAGERLRVTNPSTKAPIRLSDGTELPPWDSRRDPGPRSCELALPAVLALGRRTVCINARRGDTAAGPPGEVSLRGLPSSILPPGQALRAGQLSVIAPRLPGLSGSTDRYVDELLMCVQTAMDVLHSAATSNDFFQQAAQAVVDITPCDSARVLLRQQGRWMPAVVCARPRLTLAGNWQPSELVLDSVLRERRTFWMSPETAAPQSNSLTGVGVVVAAPILDRDREVIGVIYGDAHSSALQPAATFGELHARLVELLASGVATGLARMEQEKAAVEAEVRFSQFFTRELARELAAHKDLLDGRECDVTILFADVRGFSAHSDRLGPARTVRLVGDVMGALSECVLEHQGVLVDYIGDELIAMWGAPREQADHARLACRAALDMLGELPALNGRWQADLDGPLQLGIGVNSGAAWVGNMGSRQKFKYGPLGPVVNLASRVQGATKYLRSRLLITEHTRQRLGEGFATRRLCRARVVNMASPVTLYELAGDAQPGWDELRAGYEEALAQFERAEWREAARLLGHLLGRFADDGPAMVMCWRALQNVVSAADDADPIWELPGK
jgi:adenylate cyclase